MSPNFVSFLKLEKIGERLFVGGGNFASKGKYQAMWG